MALTVNEQRIEDESIAFAKSHKKAIAKRLTDPSIFIPEAEPVSVFMAGSPGAGKTEAALELLESIGGPPILRIDPDELRSEFAAYTGSNSWLFQRALSILVERILDHAFKQHQSFLLDGTLSSYEVACRNVQRSLDRGRVVQILYVYQQPMQAWEFVKHREAAEGRRIRPEDFVQQYFAARDVVNRLKAEFGRALRVDLLLKNLDGTSRLYRAGVDNIDHHIPEKFGRQYVEAWVAMA